MILNKNIEVKSFGSLFFDEIPQVIGAQYSGEDFFIGDSVSKLTIPWCRIGQKWIATENILLNIAWQELAARNLIRGNPVKIDGQYYLCRILNGDAIGVGDTEWDKALISTTRDDEFWHWQSHFSWSSRLHEEEDGTRKAYVHGGTSANDINFFLVAARYSRIGFRPVLEPMAPPKAITKRAIGKHIQVYGPAGKVGGVLKDFSEYDLVIEGDLFDGTDDWMATDGKTITVDRGQLVYWNRA